MNQEQSEAQARRTLEHNAAEEMALRAREMGTSVADLFAASYDVRFNGPGHTDPETIEHALDVTPELIARANAILDKWDYRSHEAI